MGRYRIHESVGTMRQSVHSFEDLEIHHPSKGGHEQGRTYASIDGGREEVLRNRTSANHLMVSKDFILSDSENKSSRVAVPAPTSGYIGRVDERSGLVAIYDRKGGELIAQVRHMDLRGSGLHEGQHIEYGRPLGKQGGFGRGNPHAYGTHVHVDFNENYLDRFKQYIRDIDTGVIASGKYPGQAKGGAELSGHHGAITERATPRNDQQLEQGDRGPEVRRIQQALDRLGYRDAHGNALAVDGDFGARSREAVISFQQAHGLHVDGVVGPRTGDALNEASERPLLSERTHSDHALFREAREGMHQLPSETFRNSVEMDNASANLALKAKQSGISHIDHVILITRGDGLIAVQGDLHSPARHFVSVDKAHAAFQSVEQSTIQLAEHAAAHQQGLQIAQVHAQMENVEHRAGLSIGMRP